MTLMNYIPQIDAESGFVTFLYRHNFPYFLNATNCTGSEEHLTNCSQGSKGAMCGNLNAVAVAYCTGIIIIRTTIP